LARGNLTVRALKKRVGNPFVVVESSLSVGIGEGERIILSLILNHAPVSCVTGLKRKRGDI